MYSQFMMHGQKNIKLNLTIQNSLTLWVHKRNNVFLFPN